MTGRERPIPGSQRRVWRRATETPDLTVNVRLVPTTPPSLRHFPLLLGPVRPSEILNADGVRIGAAADASAACTEAFTFERAEALGRVVPLGSRQGTRWGHDRAAMIRAGLWVHGEEPTHVGAIARASGNSGQPASRPLQGCMARSQLFADVAAGDRQAERPAVPLEPVQGEVVGDKAVVHLVGSTAVQQLHGRQQLLAQNLPAQLRSRWLRSEYFVDRSACAGSRQSGHDPEVRKTGKVTPIQHANRRRPHSHPRAGGSFKFGRQYVTSPMFWA